jgi:hypothetical protein
MNAANTGLQPLRHEGVWGSGYIDPHLLDSALVGEIRSPATLSPEKEHGWTPEPV